MGGAISSFVESLDKSDQMQDAAREAVKTCNQLLTKRFQLFESQLNLPIGDVRKAPAKYLVTSTQQRVIDVGKDTSKIASAITGIIDSFCKGDVAKAIGNMLQTGLDVIMGAFSAGYNEYQSYMVVVNEMGALFRIDYVIVQQKIEAKGIRSYCQNVFGSYLLITSININDLEDKNFIKTVLDSQFPQVRLSIRFKMLKLVTEKDVDEETIELVEEELNKVKNVAPQDTPYFNFLYHLQKVKGLELQDEYFQRTRMELIAKKQARIQKKNAQKSQTGNDTELLLKSPSPEKSLDKLSYRKESHLKHNTNTVTEPNSQNQYQDDS